MNIIVVGLRRSGTTAFWGMWRQDERFVCYNEPYNAQLSNVGDPSWDGAAYTAREYVALYHKDPETFWHQYAPISRHAELKDGLSDQQAEYLRWLLATGENACVDVTRCHYKLSSLREIDPDATVVHLYRPPANWVTSVVQPSSTHLKRISSLPRRLRHTAALKVSSYRFRQQFWAARGAHRFKGFGELIGTHSGTFLGVRFREAGMDADDIYAMPDVGRLLAFWKLHFERVEREGPRLFGDRFLSVNFNDFCRAPMDLVRTVYDRAGLPIPNLNVSGVRLPPQPHAAADPRWAEYAERLGLPTLTWPEPQASGRL